MQAYNIQSELPIVAAQNAPPSLPHEVRELIGFLRGARRLGVQVAFWRTKGKQQLLEAASGAMRSELLCYEPCEAAEPDTPQTLRAYEQLLANLELLIESIPFNNKVGLLRRNLITTYQQVYILRHLCHAMVCRLRMRMNSCEPFRALDFPVPQNELKSIRNQFCVKVPSWDRGSWDVYDHF
jgi:hypothetical protein